MQLFGRKKTTIGLDIGSGLVKVAVIDHAGATPELTKVVITPLNENAIVEGEVMDHAIVADAIRQTMEAIGAKKPEVVAAVGGRDVIVKKIQVERVKDAQAHELIRWEAEQHVPFDMESVELDHQILDPDGDSLEMNVLLVAAKRDLVEIKRHLLADAGVTPKIMDVDAFALHNAFAMNHPDAMKGVVALLNIGNEVTTLNILDDGVPILTRDLTVGTRRLREDLQRDHGLNGERGRGAGARLRPHARAQRRDRHARRGTGRRSRAGDDVPRLLLAALRPGPRRVRVRRRLPRPGAPAVARRAPAHAGAGCQPAGAPHGARGRHGVHGHR